MILKDLFFSLYKEDLNFKVLENAILKDKASTMALLWYLRDKDGLGRRDSFRILISYLITKEFLSPSILKSIPLIGRYDDIVDILFKCKEARTKDIYSYILNTLESDSLIAKWLPSENASSKATKEKAKFMQQFLNMTPRDYRKTLSRLRKNLNLIETKLTNKDYDIDYLSIPSLAKVKYKGVLSDLGYDIKRRYIDIKFFDIIKENLWNVIYNPIKVKPCIIKVKDIKNVINTAPKYSKEWFGDEDFFKHLKDLNIVIVTDTIVDIENIAFANSARNAMVLANNKIRNIDATIDYIIGKKDYRIL